MTRLSSFFKKVSTVIISIQLIIICELRILANNIREKSLIGNLSLNALLVLLFYLVHISVGECYSSQKVQHIFHLKSIYTVELCLYKEVEDHENINIAVSLKPLNSFWVIFKISYLSLKIIFNHLSADKQIRFSSTFTLCSELAKPPELQKKSD